MNVKIGIVAIGVFIGGCVSSINQLPKPTVPKPPNDEIVRPVEGGPIIVDDIRRCMNIPRMIECKQIGKEVKCQTVCGEIICNPGAWILCPNGLCYTADP